MKFLLTNDDGIDAPGLQALLNAVRGLGDPTIVAPLEALSGCSHRVTTDGPIRVEDRPPLGYAVAGTPADCVRVGLFGLVPEAKWVLAGVNAGGNLGVDVHHSGTVAAVREAVLHGCPGIALSQYRRRGLPIDWDRAAEWMTPILKELIVRPRRDGVFWNINLPHLEPGAPCPDVMVCPLDVQPLPLSFRRDGDWLHYNGDYHQRLRMPGADVDVCFRGAIAVTEIRLF